MASLPFIFLVIYWWYVWKNQKINFFRNFLLSSIFAVSTLWVFREYLFSPSNLYVHYNEIVMNKHFFKMTFFNIVNYLIFIGLVTFIWGLILKGLNLHLRASKDFTHRTDLTFILMLTFASAFPYIMANKSPKSFDFFDWSWRHSFLLIIPLILLTLKLESTPEKAPRWSLIRCLMLTLGCLTFISMTIIANYGHAQTMIYDKKVIELLSGNKDSWTKSEIVCFESSVKRINIARFYELNEMAWESTGETNWQFYPDKRCRSQDIPSGSLRNSPQLSGMTDSQWENVYMGGTGNSKWMAVRISGHLDVLDVLSGTFGGNNNPLNIKFSELENGTFKGSDE